jgi:Fusaric acid resistance protein-like
MSAPSFRVKSLVNWLDDIDPGVHRRIKGLRLVTAYGIAAALGSLKDITADVPRNVAIGTLAAGFALWASVSEGRATRYGSSRDLVVLCVAATLGAAIFALFSPWLNDYGRVGSEAMLITGAFLVGYLKRYGVLGTGVGSQVYIGQLLAYTAHLGPSDLWAIALAGTIAAVSAIVPRLLSGPAERPDVVVPIKATTFWSSKLSAEFVMGLQAASAASIVIILNVIFGLIETEWAITACVYVVAGTASGTIERVRRRIAGTLVGVPLGLLFLPLAADAPVVIWMMASVAMIVYAMALPKRYDIACGAFAFTLVVTLAAGGEHAVPILFSRAWETILGGALGLLMSLFLFPLRLAPDRGDLS